MAAGLINLCDEVALGFLLGRVVSVPFGGVDGEASCRAQHGLAMTAMKAKLKIVREKFEVCAIERSPGLCPN